MKYIFLLACSQSISTFFWSNWESITAKQDYITDNENKTEQPCKVGVSWLLFVRSLMKWSDVEMGRMVAVMSRDSSRECVVFCHFISNKPNHSGTCSLTFRGVALLIMFLVVEEIKIVWIYIIWLNWKIQFLSCLCVGECWVVWFHFQFHNS